MPAKNSFLPLLLVALLQGCGGNDSAAPVAATETVPASQAPAPKPVTAPAAVDTAPAADAKFQDLQGNPVELSAYAGKKVFLNYWATWCAPCIREIPAITRAAAELEDENFVFLLASDESLETITDFVADREFSGNFIKLSKFFGAWGIEAVPSSELYDENGNHVVTWSGAFEWDSPEMLEAIRKGTPMAPQFEQ
jgi:thiol-disulfide isomerase/thioredoxin